MTCIVSGGALNSTYSLSARNITAGAKLDLDERETGSCETEVLQFLLLHSADLTLKTNGGDSILQRVLVESVRTLGYPLQSPVFSVSDTDLDRFSHIYTSSFRSPAKNRRISKHVDTG